VWALMRAWGLTLPPVAEREGPALRGQVVVPDSNRRWASDLTTALCANVPETPTPLEFSVEGGEA